MSNASNAGNARKYHGRDGIHSAMEAFDRLPREVREALRNSDHNWSGEQIYRQLCKRKANRDPRLADAKSACATLTAQDIAKNRRDAADGAVLLQR